MIFFTSDSLYISNEDVFIHLLFTKAEASFIPSWISEPLRISLVTCLKELGSKFSFREAKMYVCMYCTSTCCKIGIQFSLALCSITSLAIKSCSGCGYTYMCRYITTLPEQNGQREDGVMFTAPLVDRTVWTSDINICVFKYCWVEIGIS